MYIKERRGVWVYVEVLTYFEHAGLAYAVVARTVGNQMPRLCLASSVVDEPPPGAKYVNTGGDPLFEEAT